MTERYTVEYRRAVSPVNAGCDWVICLDGVAISRFANEAFARELADEYNRGLA